MATADELTGQVVSTIWDVVALFFNEQPDDVPIEVIIETAVAGGMPRHLVEIEASSAKKLPEWNELSASEQLAFARCVMGHLIPHALDGAKYIRDHRAGRLN